MTYNTERTGFWTAVKAAPGRMSLRLKLVTALLVLVGLALAVTGLVGNAILKNYLLGPDDQSLRANENAAYRAVANFVNGDAAIQQPDTVLDFITAGKTYQVIHPTKTFGGTSGTFGFPRSEPLMPGPVISIQPNWLVTHSNSPFTVPARSGAGQWRVLLFSAQIPTSSGTVTGSIVIGVDVTSVYSTTGQLASIDLIVGLLVLALLGLIGVVVIRGSLRPLKEIEATAGAIAAGDLTRRVPERDPQTEVGSLGRSLNVMLSQIESAFDAQSESEESARRSEERMRQFVADASHELRTPLTAIRGFAEYYRQRGGIKSAAEEAAANGGLAPGDLDRIMRRVEQEAARMGVLVEDMLMLARLDQQRPLDRNTVDLLTLAADAVHDARVVAPDRQINLTVGSGAALLVNGDEVRLRQVIGNLMSNALSHTPAGTPIDVTLRAGMMAEIQGATATPTPIGHDAPRVPVGPAAVLEVTDHGPGLSAEQAQHAFERFYRADAARTTGGTGLGLAIVAALVAAHGGEVWVRTEAGQGATFAIALPLAPEAVHHPGQDDEPDEIDPEAQPVEFDPDGAAEPADAHWDETGPQARWDDTEPPPPPADKDWAGFESGRRAGG
jgi:two-component system, OmpR family, sensor kinase